MTITTQTPKVTDYFCPDCGRLPPKDAPIKFGRPVCRRHSPGRLCARLVRPPNS